MVPTVLLGVTFADATTLVSATWLAVGGIAVALREFWVGLRRKRA